MRRQNVDPNKSFSFRNHYVYVSKNLQKNFFVRYAHEHLKNHIFQTSLHCEAFGDKTYFLIFLSKAKYIGIFFLLLTIRNFMKEFAYSP